LKEQYSKLAAIIRQMGLPYAYDHFAEGESPRPPFLCYLGPASVNFCADGIVYLKVTQVNLELYTDKKDLRAEEKVERVLDNNGIFYNKTEVWIPDEKLYETVYTFDWRL